MSKNKAVTTKPGTGGNEKLLFRCVGWKGGKWILTNSSGFQRDHDPDPTQGLRQRCSPASEMEPDSPGDGTGQCWQSAGRSMGCSGGLALWATLLMSLSYWNPLWDFTVSPVPQVPCLESHGAPALSPPQRSKPRGCSGKENQGEGVRGCQKQRDWGEAAGNSVQENNQLKLGFAHAKATADPAECLWVCQLTASWLPAGWKEAPASHCHPCLLHQLTHCQSGKPLLLWVTPPLCPYERALNKMHSVHVV